MRERKNERKKRKERLRMKQRERKKMKERDNKKERERKSEREKTRVQGIYGERSDNSCGWTPSPLKSCLEAEKSERSELLPRKGIRAMSRYGEKFQPIKIY